MSQPRKSQKKSPKEIRTTRSSTTDPKIQDIDDIFSCENPGIKEILMVLKEILASQQFISSKYDELLKRNQELETMCSKLKTENVEMKTEMNELKQNTRKIENTLNRGKIEIHGIPYEHDEDIKNIIIKIGKNFEVPIKKEDIAEAYRMRKAKHSNEAQKNSPLVVTFVRREDKQKFLCMRKNRSLFSDEINIKGVRSQIFINEYLSKTTKNLFWKAKKVKLEQQYKFLWINNGNILLRKTENSKVIQVSSEEDIENLS